MVEASRRDVAFGAIEESRDQLAEGDGFYS